MRSQKNRWSGVAARLSAAGALATLVWGVCTWNVGPVSAQDAASPVAASPTVKTKPKVAKSAAGPKKSKEEAQAADSGPTKDAAVSLAAYSTGVKAFQAGSYDAAVASLSTAINGGLAPNLMPKALYYRGASYEKQGLSGQAMSDLNSALWFKTGLDDGERAKAMAARASAYAAAGLPEPTSSTQQSTSQAVAETGSLPPTKPTQASGLGGIGSLFGNVFGSATSEPTAAETPSAVVAAPANPPPMRVAANEAEVLPWASKRAGDSASATNAAGLSAPDVAADKVAKKPAVVKKAGTYRIQVAAVKSRDEASAIISKLQTLGSSVTATPATVDETKFGTMGTFFRVRLGPFATAAATKAPCDALKASGFDCLVTAK